MNMPLNNDIETLKAEIASMKEFIQGSGLMVLHGTRLDVDTSVRISELLKKLSDMETRLLDIETNGSNYISSDSIINGSVQATSAKFGDVAAGNYTAFESDGTIAQYGIATTFDDLLPVPVVAIATGANSPNFTAYNGNLKAYEFVGTGVNYKEMNLGWQISHRRKSDSSVTPHIHLFIPDNVTGGTIRFYLEYTWTNVDQTGAVATTTIHGDIVRTASQGINNNAILTFGSLSGAGKSSISSIFMARLYRDPADAADTFGASVWLKSADIHIEADTLGSRSEYTK